MLYDVTTYFDSIFSIFHIKEKLWTLIESPVDPWDWGPSQVVLGLSYWHKLTDLWGDKQFETFQEIFSQNILKRADFDHSGLGLWKVVKVKFYWIAEWSKWNDSPIAKSSQSSGKD